ncbi:MAG: hypothetical protein MH321_14935 [Leptospiraceae bacterium]|nr:hypothetical protein [Leptospiraceae bacterium]
MIEVINLIRFLNILKLFCKTISLFSIVFFLSCKNNQEIDLGNTVDFTTANREMRVLITPFLRPNEIDLFFVGIVDLIPNPDSEKCNRKYHFKRSEFDRCKLLVLSILLVTKDMKPIAGLLAVDTFDRFCRLHKVYFMDNSSLEGELNLCSVFNFKL